MCEAFVFAYLGASTLSIESQYGAIFMGLITLFALPIVRAIMVYLLPLLYALARKDFPMDSKELKICWYSGMMRGNIVLIKSQELLLLLYVFKSIQYIQNSSRQLLW